MLKLHSYTKKRDRMNRKTVSGIMLTMLLTGMSILAFNIQPAKTEPTTIIVPDDYEKIQWAIGNASIGDTIYVRVGTYYENVIVDKSVSLVGENKHSTIIDGNGIGTVMYITANDVSVTGFTIQGSGYGGWHSGIWVDHSSGNNISQNIVTNNQAGILLKYSSDNNVTVNTAIFNSYDGICLYSSSDNTVAGNIASNSMYGIALTFFSGGNTVAGNDASNNEYGISLWYDSDSNRVTGNNISNNDNGIYLFDSNFNLIFHNNFIDNTIQAYSGESTNVWDNNYPSCGNYWSDYTDKDFFIGPGQNQPGSDGIWDHPYVIDDYNQDRYPIMNLWTPSWIPPWIPSGLFADLIQRKAWPEHHHYSISKQESTYQALQAKVKNLGNQTVWVKAVFNVTKDDVSSTIIESEPVSIAQGEIADVLANLGPLTEDDIGKYRVSATCQYSHNKIVWAQGEKKKTFKFDVVP